MSDSQNGRRKSWKRDDEVLSDILGLVSIEVTPAVVSTWSDEQCQQAERWAGAVHLRASDNVVRVPPKPDFLPTETEFQGV